MILLLLGLALFLGVHLVPSVPALRSFVVRALGENGYKGVFSLISLAGFVLLVYGKGAAPYVHFFSPPSWGRHVTMTVMLLSAVCFASLYLPTNLKRFTAHPMMWGTTLWALAHLFANGDLASVLLFGGFFVWGLFDIWSENRRGAQPKEERLPWYRDLIVVVVSLLLYGLLLWVHPHAFGVAVIRV